MGLMTKIEIEKRLIELRPKQFKVLNRFGNTVKVELTF